MLSRSCTLFSLLLLSYSSLSAQGTRLLRNPDLSTSHIAFSHGADIWVANKDGSDVVRITSTAAVENHPKISPDGRWVAFSSNRSGSSSVYVASVEGGDATRLTWHPSASTVRGWTPDGKNVLFASSRDSAPTSFDRLWTVAVTGGPSEMLNHQWATNGSFSADASKIVVDRMSRWDDEFRDYRGGQNTPLVILDLSDQSETMIPSESTTEITPLWMGSEIFFLSDRDGTSNVWAYATEGGALRQITTFADTDVKTLSGNGTQLIVERDGFLFLLNPSSGVLNQLTINIKGDFPWASAKWEDVGSSIEWSEVSPTGKRAVFQSRGEIFTVPVSNGDVRNISESSGTADRAPVWSPKGDKIAWFTDKGKQGYSLVISPQDGIGETRSISIDESKMAWEPTWSPDGSMIAFVDDDVRVRIIDIEEGKIKTVDSGGNNLERGGMGLDWSPDSKWLAYAKSASNNFRQIILWSVEKDEVKALTDRFADSFSPAFDRNKTQLYFLASTDVALRSGWANTSVMGAANPDYAAYVVNLREEDDSPFEPKSDEEEGSSEDEDAEESGEEDSNDDSDEGSESDDSDEDEDEDEEEAMQIDFNRIERRTIALDLPTSNYRAMIAGPEGSVFIAESKPGSSGRTVLKFVLADDEAKDFAAGVNDFTVSNDGNKALIRSGSSWSMADTNGPSGDDGESLDVDLKMKLDRQQEWHQMFEEAWRYEEDYFYDPNMHGRDWDVVHERYAPLVPHIKHRYDLTYVLDQMNGELSVGHSFVFGGDYPETDSEAVGMLGADLSADEGRWKITKIYTTETWNPNLSSPLDRPGMNVEEGYYLVGVNGKELHAGNDPYKFMDGTLGKQTKLYLNDTPEFEGAWTEIVTPIRSENALRQRAWVENNRRKVDELSGGKLAYIWVPNTGGSGFVSFNRYYFAQQDKEGAVIDERFNGGGLLDDYMVDLMNRKLRAGLTNHVPNGKPMTLPAGILGPKVLLINELAGSGGDFFPWVFRQQGTGPLIGMRTWGGLVKSSVHYRLVDGGALTAPDNAVFDPINGKWIAENTGIAPDIEVRQDALSLSEGRDAQLEVAVQEALKLLTEQPAIEVVAPDYSSPARN